MRACSLSSPYDPSNRYYSLIRGTLSYTFYIYIFRENLLDLFYVETNF